MDISPATRRLMLKRALKGASSEDYVSWALERAEEGADSQSLWILAGLHQPHWQQLDHYFAATLRELNEVLPEPEKFLRFEARQIVREISDGSIEPVEGCHQVANIHQALDYDSEFERFYHLSHEMSAMFEKLPEETLIEEIKDAARRLLNDELPVERWHFIS